jgi:hypothetical protein
MQLLHLLYSWTVSYIQHQLLESAYCFSPNKHLFFLWRCGALLCGIQLCFDGDSSELQELSWQLFLTW